MSCLRDVGISILAASLLGCGSSEPAAATTAPVEETGADQDSEVPADDAGATPEDTKPALEYPPGPYGKTVGAVIPNATWDGYKDGTGEWTKLSLLDYYDPDGSRGINAIKIG